MSARRSWLLVALVAVPWPLAARPRAAAAAGATGVPASAVRRQPPPGRWLSLPLRGTRAPTAAGSRRSAALVGPRGRPAFARARRRPARSSLWRRVVLGELLRAGTARGARRQHARVRARPPGAAGRSISAPAPRSAASTSPPGRSPLRSRPTGSTTCSSSLRLRRRARRATGASAVIGRRGQLDDVSKRFGSDRRPRSASPSRIGEGEVVAVLGPNGAGKSTAISILLGLRRPDAGAARLFGADPARPRRGARRASRRRRPPSRRRSACASSSSSSRALRQPAAGRRLVRAVRARRGWSRGRSAGSRAASAGASGVALAFAGSPRLVVLDEPTAGLDREARLAVWAAVRAHARSGRLAPAHDAPPRRGRGARASASCCSTAGGSSPTGRSRELKAAAGMTARPLPAPPRGVDCRGRARRRVPPASSPADGGAEVERLVRSGRAARGARGARRSRSRRLSRHRSAAR